jgi:nitrite reductase/ring-hydroxylating ferredoxin subunit
VLGRTEEGYVAFDDRCTHRGGSLAGGVMIGGVVQCPWHGSQFDCRRGAVNAGPAEEPIATYRVTEREGRLLLALTNKEGRTSAQS